MASSNACWGVEIGSGAIKAVKLEADGDSVSVTDFTVINHPKVLSTPELDTAEATRMALGALSGQHDLSSAPLAVSVAGHQSFARFAKLPPVEPKKVPDIVKFEAVQQIPFPLEEVEWDYQTFVSPDSPDVEVGIFAVTRPRIMELLGQVGEFGQTPEIATLGPVAAYNALAFDLEFTADTPGTIILDIGTTATDMIIAEAGRVWVRTFPLGGHQFTDALVTSFKLSYSKAERLKREAEQTKHARHVFQAMRPVFTDLVQEVQRSIGYYQSMHAGADLKRLIGLGSTFRLPGLRKYLKQQLHMDIYRIEEFKRAKAPAGREAEFDEASLNLATAYGLALQGLGRATLEANVMPVKVVRDSMWRHKRLWFGAAAGLAAAATAGFFVRPLMDMTAMNSVSEPSSIARVVSEGKLLKDRAEQAGVLGDATGDTTASELIGLASDGEVYANLVNDLGRMTAAVRSMPIFADAEEDVFRVATLKTDYKEAEKAAPGRKASRSPDPDPLAGQSGLLIIQPQIVGMNRPGRANRAAADFPTEMEINGATVELKTKRRVNVTLEVATKFADPEEVAMAAVQWLRDHSGLEGTVDPDSPYVIVLKNDDEEVYEETSLIGPLPTGTGSPGPAGRARPSRPNAGSSGIIFSAPAGRPANPGMRAPGRPSGRGAVGLSDDPADLIREMEELAPIGPPIDPAASGRRPRGGAGAAPGDDGEKAYQVTFTLVLDKPGAAGLGEGES